MGQWIEYYLELYSRENSVAKEVLNVVILPVLEELDSDPSDECPCKKRKTLNEECNIPFTITELKKILHK